MKASAAFAWRVMLMSTLAHGGVVWGQGESLHSLIDKKLAVVAGVEPQRTSDAEFLRRVSLDLVGMPPTSDEARAFLADAAADKRERLIDRLFASPHFARRLAEVLDLVLMERRANTNVSADEWQTWLLKSVQENKPWNVLAREILAADGEDPAQRPAARFALDRASDPNMLTRDIGRIFFGRDMQCAQCHDHPLVADYLQSDYHGLLAFVSPSYAVVRKEGDKQVTLQAEKFGGDLTFESVFVGKPRRTGARMPGGAAIDEPFFLPGDEYDVPPAENVKSVPKFSRRKKLAEMATDGSNQAFNRNIANRLWALMFGRGLVHPVDWNHPDNPAVDPELLQILTDQVAAMNFDVRQFLRELALTTAYQRSYDLPEGTAARSTLAQQEVERLELRRDALQQAADRSEEAYTTASEAWEQAETAMLPVAGELDAARAKYTEARQKVDEAEKALAEAESQLAAKKLVADPVQQAATAAEKAAQALADDKELADAAQKFVARSKQLNDEMAGLSKSVDEKAAAVPPMVAAWNGTKTVIDETVTKKTPLTDAYRHAEQVLLTARLQRASDAEAVAALDRRLETAHGVAQLDALQESLATASASLPLFHSKFSLAQSQLSDLGPVIIEGEARVQAAADESVRWSKAIQSATSERARRADAAGAIAAAAEAAKAAGSRVPDDTVLADVFQKLQQRAAAARTEVEDFQRHLDEATALEGSAKGSLAAAQNGLNEYLAERARLEQAVDGARKALTAAEAEASAKRSEFQTAVDELTGLWTNDFSIAPLKPLSPEQLCWTIFRVTGVYDRHWKAEVAELDKSKPLTDEQKNDPAQNASRDKELEQRTYDKLKGNIATFVAYYGAAAGQPQGDFFATADQALFVENGGAINGWVAPAGDNVTERIAKLADTRAAAEELYLAVLTRLPSEDEATVVVEHLGHRGDDKNAAAQELVWGLMNSAEFRFNH